MKPSNSDSARGVPSNLWDTLVRIALIGGLIILCFRVFSPFLNLLVWSIVLAIILYPLHQWLVRKIGGKQGLTSIILALLAVLLVVTPTWLLVNSFADSVNSFVGHVQQNTLQVPAPSERVKSWPVVGNKVHGVWSQANSDLPGLVQTMQPKLGELARGALSMVASIGGVMLLFLASFIVACIFMAYGTSAARSGRAFLQRVAGAGKGDELAKLVVATIRAVALGILGIAAIQALLVGLALMLAGIRVAGVLAIVTLILGIAQVPALIVTLPVIIYIWASGDYSTGSAVTHTIILLVVGMADNVLKPLMLGRGVDVPMPVMLLGALGGMATGGILGMFVGATALALGYVIFQSWVATPAEVDEASPEEQVKPADSLARAT